MNADATTARVHIFGAPHTLHDWHDGGLHIPPVEHMSTNGARWAEAKREGQLMTERHYQGAPQQSWGAYHVEKLGGIGYSPEEHAARRAYAGRDGSVQGPLNVPNYGKVGSCCSTPDVRLESEEGYECFNCGMVLGHRRP